MPVLVRARRTRIALLSLAAAGLGFASEADASVGRIPPGPGAPGVGPYVTGQIPGNPVTENNPPQTMIRAHVEQVSDPAGYFGSQPFGALVQATLNVSSDIPSSAALANGTNTTYVACTGGYSVVDPTLRTTGAGG